MIALFSLNEPGDKPRIKNLFSYKKPGFWIVLTSVVLIITVAVTLLPNALKTPAISEPSTSSGQSIASVPSEIPTASGIPVSAINPNPIPADLALFEIRMRDSDEQYISDFESNGETILYDWITNAEESLAYANLLKLRFDVLRDLSNTLNKYDDEYFKTGVLMPVILRSENNISYFYSGNTIKTYPEFPYAKNYGSIQTFTFSLGASSAFELEFSQLKDDTKYYKNSPNWWIALVELQKSDFQDLSPQIKPTLTAKSDRGNTDRVALRSEEVRYYQAEINYSDTYQIIGFEDQVKLLLDARGKILFYGFDFQLMPNIIAVRENDGWHIYNKSTLLPVSDKAYTDLQQEECSNYEADVQRIAAKRNGKFALMDNYGNELTDAVYDKINFNSYDWDPPAISVVQNGKYGAVSNRGKLLVPAQYDFLTADHGSHIYVFKNNQWGLIKLDDNFNASEPDWSVQLPESIFKIYNLFYKPFYEMDESETKICELFADTYGFDMLASDTGEISDMYMAMYATMYMPDYNEEKGHSKAEYDAVTMKYFGKTLTDYTGNGELEFIPGTDRLIPTGWGVEFSPEIVALTGPLKKEGEVYTGTFYYVYLDEAWCNSSYETYDAIRQLFYNREWKPFVRYGYSIGKLEIKFSVGQEKDGSNYLVFYRMKRLESN